MHLHTCALLVCGWLISAAYSAESPVVLDLGRDVRLELVLIEHGTFARGSLPSEAGRGDDEVRRQVTLSQDFYLGKVPVTVGQFRRFAEETGYRTEAERGTSGGFGFDGKALVQRKEFTWRNPGFPQTDEHPVTIVTYDDAQAFLAWLAKKTGRKTTLPTEAQWEYACRAGTTTRFSSGDDDPALAEIGWFRGNAGDGTRPVGQKKPNAFGLYDLSGNVYEWCRDWYGPYTAGDATDPEATRAPAGEPPRRVLRGGSWLKDAVRCRSAARYRNASGSRNADNGFRVAALVGMPAPAVAAAEPIAVPQPKPAPLPPEVVEKVRETLRHGPPQPQRPPAPVPVAAPVSVRGNFLGMLCLGSVCVGLPVLILLMWIVLRGQRDEYATQPGTLSGTGAPLMSPNPLPGRKGIASPYVEPAHDGFWLHLGSVLPGSIVHYHCLVHGVPCQQTVVAESGQRQFVYTGGQPTEIAIGEVVPPDEDARSPVVRPEPFRRFDEDRPEPPPSPPPFSGFPAAY